MKKLMMLSLIAALAAGMAAAQANKTDPGVANSIPKPSPATVATPENTTVAAAPATSETATVASLPAGTPVQMKLETAISTASNQTGDRFAGRVTQPVILNGKTVIPVGSALEGRVGKVSDPRAIGGRPSIDLRPETITLPDGQRFDITATVTDTDHTHNVSDEGTIKGSFRSKGDNIELAAGAGAGAVTGAVIGGGKGALIGGAIGATITTVHWLTKRHSETLPAGTEITMELSRPMTISAGSGGR